jgi:dTDP-4-dehydrorhamnose 3,5-epimerase
MVIKLIKTNLIEVFAVEHPRFKDHRGSFIESFNENLYKKIFGKKINFVQDDFSYSKKNVIRGFHGEKKITKLVSCIRGKIRLVIFCNKKNHKDYLKHYSTILSETNNRQVLVPPNYGICHQVKSDFAIFHYKQSGYYDPLSQFTFKWNDDRLKIKWDIVKPILSKRDSF